MNAFDDARWRPDALDALVDAVLAKSNRDFHGFGIIVADDAARLPVFQLPAVRHRARGEPGPDDELLDDRLARYACASTSLHDGFHVLSPDLHLRIASCYVAAPVPPREWEPPCMRGMEDRIGSRWITGLFASLLPGVVCVLVVNSQRVGSRFVGGEWAGHA
ncbi:hypothetical protein [Burkholderia oklahomensis]|uniref:Uncharacterized protein n=1 Tax=Burkholderia oklahomensis TaxID=342113 RepID=A0AAI8FNN6_9BURK|nr:hypothetical protein [Burkholderia oklahomensis]AIO67065.1 hypothetical protein DM82_842 [Burkholderia oklahomensis]AJX31351.1 hypothetical protein BG90_88 [Burkholderia oklahomensis C6786]AOI42827.1 hypothetical protein WG70_25100 [Burkholderia oklahomensis EO147]AOI46317.1 hypothetical protein WI23_11295 [Burkholderia oklahomensis C6786]KUY53925.1 hypothetical protein WI23_01195 [Burkholderia oklahomensis C6786]